MKELLGTYMREKHTGIDGIVISVIQHLHRTDEVCLLREGVNHDGVPFENFWFDIDRCEKIES